MVESQGKCDFIIGFVSVLVNNKEQAQYIQWTVNSLIIQLKDILTNIKRL
jgi:hypothetical protein